MSRKAFHSPLAALLLIASLATAFWVHRVYLEEPKFPPMGAKDLIRHAYPTAAYLHNELQSGNLPLWNPYQMAGQPFVALHVTGAFYPPNIVLMGLLPPARALEALALVHLVIAGFFSWLFAARLGLVPAARIAAAVGFMFSGVLLSGIYALPCLSTSAWLPALLWALHGLLTEGQRRWALALALVLAHAFLAGYAQAFFYQVQLAFAYGLFGLVALTPRSMRLRVLALTALAGLLALGLVAPQLFLTLELTQEAVRSFEGLSLIEASYGSISPSALLNGIFRGLGPEFVDNFPSPLRWRMTLPIVTLPLIASGLLVRRLRAQWLFLVCSTVAVILFMLGRHTPVFAFIHSLPLGDVFRSPRRIDLLYVFLVSVLTAIGIHGLSERLSRSHAPSALAGTVSALLALLLAVDSYTRTEIEIAHPAASAPIQAAPPELIRYLRAQPGRERVFLQTAVHFHAELLQKAGMIFGVFALPDYESNMPQIYQDFLTHRRSPLWFWHGGLSVVREMRGDSPPPRAMAYALDLMSVRYYAGLHPRRKELTEGLQKFAGGAQHHGPGFVLFERPSALPRVYSVRRVVYESSIPFAIWRVQRDQFRPREEALLVDPARDPSPLEASDRPPTTAADVEHADRAEIIEYEAERVVIAAECGAPCLLVLTDLYYPGWRAYVDGHEVDVLRVNALFRGVQLEPGSHRVTYRYQPASFRNGLLVLVGSLLAATLGLAYLPDRSPAREPAS